MRLIVREGSNAGRQYPLRGNKILIGSSPKDDVVIPTNKGVSVHHAEIGRRRATQLAPAGHPADGPQGGAEAGREGDNWLLVDLGSSGGTWVNGKELTGPHTLKVGDRIQIGETVLEVQEGGAPERWPLLSRSQWMVVGTLAVALACVTCLLTATIFGFVVSQQGNPTVTPSGELPGELTPQPPSLDPTPYVAPTVTLAVPPEDPAGPLPTLEILLPSATPAPTPTATPSSLWERWFP